ncbi:MAG: hypothetical protein COT39_00250 [Parcubacteria group bacterium CG08_land_8_20_14_0_20_48_21]|nr:MAG: hypothetical protein COT39_00250 [Parcubacteria group bacterium CG08_land_8_20_14_0_20_48_21]PIY78126.1 MAG: hypothetical protein COY83_01535 [Parcubacteria group bacterium CG_4_10_14_0_8_um_filter_48_154]PIZ77053.1 MAG: hypothetical protein COY03_04115 [bacterium CG_4_10_14_0_2_um_filter_48_144]PJC39468.1 MAG: hypothetical protein CO043_04075 [Parcubacteria group bacterium CG_4_9_14_0_2_um_filter_48_40]
MPQPEFEKIDTPEVLLKENNALLKEIYKSTEKTRRYILVGKVMNFIYLSLILVPLVWGYIVFAPHLNILLATYKDLLVF